MHEVKWMLEPLGDYVILEVRERKASEIVLPDASKLPTDYVEFFIYAVGEKVNTKLKPGAHVLPRIEAGLEFIYEKQHFILVREANIIAVVKEEGNGKSIN